MASYTISPIWGAGAQLFDNSGNVLTGGKIYTYLAGTTTPATTYTTPTGAVANSNPIIANSAGRLTNEIWFPVSGAYKFVLKDANDVLLATYDNIPTTPQPPIVNDASSVAYEPGYEVTAGGFTVGATYLITSVGTTDFVAIGAAANVTGIHFTATGVGSGTGTAEYSRTVQAKLRETVSVKDFGAVGDGVTDDTAAIQAAVNAVNGVGGGAVYFPTGTYKVTSTITIYSNMKLYGNGKASLLKWGVAAAGGIFSRNSSTIENVSITMLGFDGEINYPAASDVGINTFTEYNSAIYFNGTTVTNLTVQNCYFSKLSNSSIDINGLSSSKILIDANIFEKGAYRWKVISVRTPTNPATRYEYPNSIVVSNNVLNENGPQVDFDPDPSINWNGSCDAIQLDQCRDSLVVGNVVKRSSGTGIRIEECENVTVCGNTTLDTGASGITLYNESNNCAVVGNVVENWGRIPPANSIRSYAGNYYVTREEVSPFYGVSPPADPSTSPFFDVWPYSLDNVITANIQAYSVLETTLYPFRGYAGISATARSKSNTITGNVVTRNTSVDGSGKYLYANDFGFTVVHNANSPSTNAANNVVTGNRFVGQVYDIYHPQYTDPINTNGSLTSAIYGANDTLNNNLIYINALSFEDLSVKSQAGTGTETMLTLLNQTNAPGAGLGVKVEFQTIAATLIGFISAAMKSGSYANGTTLTLSTLGVAGDSIDHNAGGSVRMKTKGTGQVNFVPLASAPSGAEEGDVYFNTTTKKLQCYNGSTWVDLF